MVSNHVKNEIEMTETFQIYYHIYDVVSGLLIILFSQLWSCEQDLLISKALSCERSKPFMDTVLKLFCRCSQILLNCSKGLDQKALGCCVIGFISLLDICGLLLGPMLPITRAQTKQMSS